MGKHIRDDKNWKRWNGGMWLNFHDYHYYEGSILTVVRFRQGGKGFTRDMLGKYRKDKRGNLCALRSDDTYKDEDPSSWWSAERLITLREALEGGRSGSNSTEEI
jgi:hypothetical protein